MQKQLLSAIGLALLAVITASAQPAVSSGSVVNAASYTPDGLPNSGVAQGSMFIVFGQRLGPATLQQISAYPLPTSLSGTSIKVTVSGTTTDAIMIYTSASQVAAILPSSTPVGTGTFTVTYNGQTSAPAPIRVVQSAFGIFAVNQSGSGPGVIQNATASPTALPVTTVTASAQAGDTVVLWGTGLGPVQGNEAGGALPGDLNLPVTVYVGGRQATVTYKGRSGCCAGIDQIVFQVPQGVEGCYVPVVVQVNNTVSNFTSMSIARSRGVCSDPISLSGTDLQTAQTAGGLRQGSILLSSFGIQITVPVLGSLNVNTESGSATFGQFGLTSLNAASNLYPSTGCQVYNFKGSSAALPTDPVKPNYIDAGTLTLQGPNGSKSFTRDAVGIYSASLSTSGLPGTATPAYLTAGQYTITGTGGSGTNAVGPFTARLTINNPVNWTNQAAVNTVVRSSGQQITWSGGDPDGYVIIGGTSVDTRGSVGGGFACVAPARDQQFTIPAYVLLALPASAVSSSDLTPTSILTVLSSSVPSRFTATGLDVGTVAYTKGSAKSVVFQ